VLTYICVTLIEFRRKVLFSSPKLADRFNYKLRHCHGFRTEQCTVLQCTEYFSITKIQNRTKRAR